MSDFYCDLEGNQKLQIWYVTIGTMYQSQSAPSPLTPQQARLELSVYNNPVVGTCDEYRYYAAFPHSPYLEHEFSSDWLRANHAPWQHYELCQRSDDEADQQQPCPGCGSDDTFLDAVMVDVWQCRRCSKVWSDNAVGQAYTPF